MLQTIEITGTFPLAHGEVVEQVVATGLGLCGRYFVLGEYPLQTFDGELAHVLNGVSTYHDDIHTGEATHGTHVDHIVLDPAVAEPCGHEVLQAVHGSRGHGRFLVGFGDAQVVCGEPFILAGDVDTGLQLRVVDRKTLNNLHDLTI